MLNDKERDALSKRVGNNLRAIMKLMGWNQAQLAEKMDMSTGGVSGYIRGTRQPTLEFMVSLCALPDFQKNGVKLSIDDLVHKDLDPEEGNQKLRADQSDVVLDSASGDFLGNYICYFFDQSKPDDYSDEEMRYGVLSVYDAVNASTGDRVIRAMASFFEDGDADAAISLKRTLDEAFETHRVTSERNAVIASAFRREHGLLYEGSVTFSDYNVFVHIRSGDQRDNALMILYSPHYRSDAAYGGGLGSVSSVTQDEYHEPTAQKFFMTKYELNCPYEEIFETLRMARTKNSGSSESDAKALCEFCRKVYQDELLSRSVSESDKTAMVHGRLNQLVARNLEKNIRTVGSVSEDEDRTARKLIVQYKKS